MWLLSWFHRPPYQKAAPMLRPLPIEDPALIERLKFVDGFVYVASPYSRYPDGIDEAFREASRVSAWLLRRGVKLFCPIAHSHPISNYGFIDPNNHEIWLPADKPLMDAAGALLVVMMPSWQESYGIGVEIDTFVAARKPIFFLTWPRPESQT